MLVDQSPSFAGKRIAVVGAGLMGRMMAYALAKGGAEVSLYDRGGADGEHAAAMVAAAMLAPLAESAITEPNVVQMGMYSLPRWQAFTAELSLPVFFSKKALSLFGINKMPSKPNALPRNWSAIATRVSNLVFLPFH
jgi:flavin-dependent dehydrogenase